MTNQEKLNLEYPDSDYITTELAAIVGTATYSVDHNPHLMPKASLRKHYIRAKEMLLFAEEDPITWSKHISGWKSIIRYVNDKYPEVLI